MCGVRRMETGKFHNSNKDKSNATIKLGQKGPQIHYDHLVQDGYSKSAMFPDIYMI